MYVCRLLLFLIRSSSFDTLLSPFQMCVCLEEYIFLGSRLGNSLLVRFTEQDQDTVITIDDSDILGKDKEKEKEKGLC